MPALRLIPGDGQRPSEPVCPMRLDARSRRPGLAHEEFNLCLDLPHAERACRRAATEGLPLPLWVVIAIEANHRDPQPDEAPQTPDSRRRRLRTPPPRPPTSTQCIKPRQPPTPPTDETPGHHHPPQPCATPTTTCDRMDGGGAHARVCPRSGSLWPTAMPRCPQPDRRALRSELQDVDVSYEPLSNLRRPRLHVSGSSLASEAP